MKIIKMAALACIAAFMSSGVQADQREFAGNGQAACITEELHDQLISAAVDQDERGINYLLQNGCFIPKAGVPVSVLDRTWTGTVKVRAYVDDQAFELWTVREALTD